MGFSFQNLEQKLEIHVNQRRRHNILRVFCFQNLEQKRKSNAIGAPNKKSNIVLFRPNQTKINMENIWMKNKNTKISILLKRPKIAFLGEKIFPDKKAPPYFSPDLKVGGGGFLNRNSPDAKSDFSRYIVMVCRTGA